MNRHPVIRIEFLCDAFGSQPFLLAVILADTVAARFVGPFAKTKVGDDQPIAADRDQNIGRTYVAVNVLILVNKRHPLRQLFQSNQIGGHRAGILYYFRIGYRPILKTGSASLESEIPAKRDKSFG